MNVTISDAVDYEMWRLFEIASMAFSTNEAFWNATWPNHMTQAGRETGAKRFRETRNGDPSAKFVKAVDDATGKIVGVAKWSIFIDHVSNSKKSIQKDNDAGDDDKAYQQYLATQFLAERRDAIEMSGGNIICVDLLAVDPSYQRRGIASALVAWGTKIADELGLESVVESSTAGQGVYQMHGYVLHKTIQIHVPPKWAHRGGQDFAWLVRPRALLKT